MTMDGPGTGGRHRDWPPRDDDDLDRAFGPDTASVPVRTTPQRVRSWSLLLGGVVVVAVVLVVALSMIIGSVQTGVGGIFPRPDATLAKFTSEARTIDGVAGTSTAEPTKTSFASYDVTATVTTTPGLVDTAREDLVDRLSAAAADTSGNGVHVWAVADFGDVEVGISPSDERTEQRLALAWTVRAIPGVQEVHCLWTTAGESRSDEPDAQAVTVETAPTGVDQHTAQTRVAEAVHRVFPDATVEVAPAKS
ncbi:hypothetical protein EDF24_2729 [Curtobacterium sp. PhB130]|uniref:hypothetical protein n=1 Tax=Curtobacterium sp. PhB130 TaxID=2485178 RepID=UPI000F4CB541|nr:hypothetical protein [Curtobacterium sp. PhB130]ROS73729.1 hypothetical protein EDF24_2729 [Curtobacterium sp. PhB130]